MGKRQKRGFWIAVTIAACLFLIGIVMLIVNATANGKVGEDILKSVDASINEWGIIFISVLFLVGALFSIPKTRE